MRKMPYLVKQRFILAKAVRIASISRPDEKDLKDLVEAVNADDVISSYILKTMILWDEHVFRNYRDRTPAAMAHKIYEALHRKLEGKRLKFIRDASWNCTKCVFEKGCCKRMQFMLAMVRKILEWLKQNEHDLKDVDFVDDVDLFEEWRRKVN